MMMTMMVVMMIGNSSAREYVNQIRRRVVGPPDSSGISHCHCLFNHYCVNCNEVISAKIGTHVMD